MFCKILLLFKGLEMSFWLELLGKFLRLLLDDTNLKKVALFTASKRWVDRASSFMSGMLANISAVV
jgi:hypothetical protein